MILYGYTIDPDNKFVKMSGILPFVDSSKVFKLSDIEFYIDEFGNEVFDYDVSDVCTLHILKKWLVPLYKIGGVIYDK